MRNRLSPPPVCGGLIFSCSVRTDYCSDYFAERRSKQGVAPASRIRFPPASFYTTGAKLGTFLKSSTASRTRHHYRSRGHGPSFNWCVLVFHAVPSRTRPSSSPPFLTPCELVQRAASAGFTLQTHWWGNTAGISTPAPPFKANYWTIEQDKWRQGPALGVPWCVLALHSFTLHCQFIFARVT